MRFRTSSCNFIKNRWVENSFECYNSCLPFLGWQLIMYWMDLSVHLLVHLSNIPWLREHFRLEASNSIVKCQRDFVVFIDFASSRLRTFSVIHQVLLDLYHLLGVQHNELQLHRVCVYHLVVF